MDHAELYAPDALEKRLAAVRARIAAAAVACGRDPGEVTLVAVSKRHPAQAVRTLAGLGQDLFGESYAQEALAKQDELADLDLRWHFIGRLQKNKAKYVAGRFSLIHSADSLELAQALHKRALAVGSPQAVLLQANLDREPQKGGAAREAVFGLAEAVMRLDGLRLAGLMVMPPYDPDPEASRPSFAGLRALRDALEPRLGLDLPVLSMGMSHDLETAVAEGASHVRVGTDIFGERPTETT